MTTINSQEDFLRALRENPEWRDAVRTQILGDELLQLPVWFDAFVQQQIAFNERIEGSVQRIEAFVEQQVQLNQRIEARMERIETDVTELRTDVAELRTDVTELRTDVTELRTDVAELRTTVASQTGRIDNALGYNYQSRVERNIPSIAGQYLQLRNTTVLRGSLPHQHHEPEELMDRALDDILITQDQRDDLWLLDLIFTGRDRATGDYLYIAAETSITIGDDDVTRAADRAATLVLSQRGFGICLRKEPIELSCLVGSVEGGGGSDGQGQIRGWTGTGTTGRATSTDPGWQKLSPSDR